VGSVTPVTLVAHAPTGDFSAPAEAPEPQTAQAEQPVPEAVPEPIAPAPQVQSQPPAPQPAPAKAQTPQAAKTQAPAKPEKSLDLDALEASLSKLKPAGGKPSSAAKGPSRSAAAPEPHVGLSAAAQASLNGLTDDLERRWNPNCEVEGGRDVQVRVLFMIGSSGGLAGDVASQIKSAQTPAAQVAAERAVRAVYAAAPFPNLPKELYGQKIAVNFDAKHACS
jgi:outer membrane biosynthesis protein TonB